MQLTDLQKEKTDKILSIFQNSGKKPPIKVDFKAPTGSGKTLMASAVIAGMINRVADKKLIFIIATVSTADLPYFFEKKLNQYKPDLEYSDFEAEYIESPSSSSQKNKNQDMQIQIRPEQNKVYIFGKATFGKGRIFTEQNVIADFINECKQQGYSIAYIRDEAHIGQGNNADIQTFENLMAENAEYILRMTATFNKRDTQTPKVELTEKELKDPDKNNGKWLIKCTPKHLRNEAITDKEILTQAIKDFRQVQQEYKNLNIRIRPAMLIQVDNNPSTDPERSNAFAETLEMAKTLLMENGLSWVQYFGGNDKDSSNVDNKDFTLDKITRNDDTTDCIIFKIGPATGWDIPRACMLVQLRNVCSKTLNIQTIGRIKRNPYPGLEKNDITDKYYIYTNEKRENNANAEYSVFDYKVKEAYKDECFAVIKHKQKQDDTVQQKTLKEEIIKFLQENSNAILTRISESFPQGKNEYLETQNKVIIKSPILLLKLIKARQNCLSPIQKQAINAALESYTKIEDLKSVNKETMHIILLANFLSHIKKIAKAAAEQSVSYEIMEEKIDPDAYCSIVEDSGNTSYQTGKNYLFDIKKNGQDINAQMLDSNNEIAVFNTINHYIQFIGGIKVWAKNQRSGNICGAYLGHDNTPHKSYFDFIIKYENGVMLYIEVKGEPDINPEKTECLKASYSKYFETQKGQSELFDKIVVICIAKVNNNNQITPELFYDKEKITNNFTGKTFENILKELGKL